MSKVRKVLLCPNQIFVTFLYFHPLNLLFNRPALTLQMYWMKNAMNFWHFVGLMCTHTLQCIFKRQLSVHRLTTQLPTSKTFPPGAHLLSPSCEPAASSRCCFYPVSKPQLVQVCVQLGCQVPVKLKQTWPPVPSMQREDQNLSCITPPRGLPSQSVNQTEEKLTCFP